MKQKKVLALLLALVLTLGLVFVPTYGTSEAAGTASVSYRSYVQSYGWLPWVNNGKLSGKTGEAKRLECLQVKLDKQPVTGGVKYRSYVQGKGWTDWVNNGAKSGIQGEQRRIESVQIKLTGKMAQQFDIYYRVHVQSFGWLAWAKNGESAGSAGVARRIEGVQITIVDKGAKAPTNLYNIKSTQSSSYIGKVEGTEILCKNSYSSLAKSVSAKCTGSKDNYIAAVIDLDKDGVPEMIVLPGQDANNAVQSYSGIYILSDGKAKNVLNDEKLKTQYTNKLKKLYSDTSALTKDPEMLKLMLKFNTVCKNYGIDATKLLAGDEDEAMKGLVVLLGFFDEFSKTGKIPEIKGLDTKDLPLAVGNKSAADVLTLIKNIKIK
jgi:uncharacterized protein YjdB